MVVVIVGRELAVTGLRGIASSQGVVVAATWPGKVKTLAQNVAAVALLFHFPVYGLPAHEIGLTLLAVATALTLWSGYEYFAEYFGWRESTSVSRPLRMKSEVPRKSGSPVVLTFARSVRGYCLPKH